MAFSDLLKQCSEASEQAADEASAETPNEQATSAGYDQCCADDLGQAERSDFCKWLVEANIDMSFDALCRWRSSDEYESAKLRFLTNFCRCSGLCKCTYDGEGLTPHVPLCALARPFLAM